MKTTCGVWSALVALQVAGAAWLCCAQAQQTASQTGAQDPWSVIEAARMQAALEPVPAKTIPLFSLGLDAPFGNYWMLEADTPPSPYNPFPELPVYPLGDNWWLVDDRSVDYDGLQAQQAKFYAEGGEGAEDSDPPAEGYNYTTNDLWLEITAFTNNTASLVIHRPWNDTNLPHDLFYTTNLSSPVIWRFVQRCISTNVLVPDLCDAQGFFRLGQTNGNLTVTTNRTPQELAQLLVPPWVSVTNATYTGEDVARGTFAGGHGCGLPIETGVMLSSGDIALAVGTNDNFGAGFWNQALSDADLDRLVQAGGGQTLNAAVLEFDIVWSHSFVLQFQYIFASEEYPEWIGPYNDPMAIFVSTNYDGTNWIIDATNNIAVVPLTSLPVSVNTINGGWEQGGISPTNPQYYVDNKDPDPGNSAMPPYAAQAPVYNVQYDGTTVLLIAQIPVSANVTNHVKIAIEDYRDGAYDSAVFIKAWSPASCCQCQ